jgi:protein PhnA
MPHTAQLKETAELITRFTKGEAEEWEWSAFEAVPSDVADLETLRQEVLAVAQKHAPRHGNEWCAPDGMAQLDRIASRLLGVAEDDDLVVKDSNGTRLANGDSVTLIKDLPVKGANVTLKRGTVAKNIRLTLNPEEIECNVEKVRGLVLRVEFVKKAN